MGNDYRRVFHRRLSVIPIPGGAWLYSVATRGAEDATVKTLFSEEWQSGLQWRDMGKAAGKGQLP